MKTVSKFLLSCLFCLKLCLFSGCGGDGGVSLTPIEKTEADKFIERHGKAAIVHYLYEQGERSERDEKKINLKFVKYFVLQGADVNATGYGITPLIIAVERSRNFEVAQFLISKGADVNAKNHNGLTPLHAALTSGLSDVEMIKFLVSKGADVNAKSHRGVTPLHMAAESDFCCDEFQFLVSKGADVNATNDDGETPLDLAKKLTHLKWLEYLNSTFNIQNPMLDEINNPKPYTGRRTRGNVSP